MITHNPTFETLANAPVKTTDVIVARQLFDAYGYIDEGLKYMSSTTLMQVNIDSIGQILGQVTKKATVKLLGTDVAAVPLTLPLVGDLFQIRLGLYNNDPSVAGFQYISEGFFLVETIDVNYDEGYTTLTLYDHMYRANKLGYAATVPSTAITYPISVQDFATYIASVMNLTIDPNFSTLPNASYMIQEDLYSTQSGTTVQTAVQDIAGATGTTVRQSDMNLIFSPYSVNAENLSSANLKTLKIGETYGPITSVVLGRQPQNDNIALFASSPTNGTVTAVNTTTNVISITDSGMITGNMVYFMSTGTLPAPLVAGHAYYTYMVSGDDTFKLSDTYAHAIAGTNFVDLTTAGTGTITIAPLTTQEIQINNNEILDDDRETLIQPLYNVLSGIDWTDVKADTIGLGWHECGDIIQFTQGGITVRAFLDEVHLTLAGSIKEQLISTIPKVAAIDYQAAGGIAKTLNNTEIKVDKQAQDITSIVEEQTTFEGETTTNFTEVYQNINNILLTIQGAGGGNLALNSVGFATESTVDGDAVTFDKLSFWYYNHNYTYPFPTDGLPDAHSDYQIDTQGTVTSYSSSESQNAGALSGQVIEINGNGLIMEQYIPVAANTPMCFGVRIKKDISMGSATITLYNTNDTFTLSVANLTAYVWDELKIENFVSTMPWIKIKIQSSSVTHLQLTDLRLLYGSTLQGWVQSASEILATNVQFSKLGMRIFDNVHDTETQVTYNEFSTRRRTDGKVLFEADDQGVITNDLTIKGSTNYMDSADAIVVRQITIPKGNSRSGVAFIKVS